MSAPVHQRNLCAVSPSSEEQSIVRNAIDHRLNALSTAAIGEQHRFAIARGEALALHGVNIGPDIRSEVDLVDDQEIAIDDSGTALARDIVAVGDINDEQPIIRVTRSLVTTATSILRA